MRAKGRNVKCPNHREICTANLDRTDVIGNESRSAERCARKIAQDETPLVVGQFNECFLHSCPHCLLTQATMLSDV
jgi:hypothetical protein